MYRNLKPYLRVGRKVPRAYSVHPQFYHLNVLHTGDFVVVVRDHGACDTGSS